MTLDIGPGIEDRKAPKIRLYFPIWWHHHGEKIRLNFFDAKKQTLVLIGSAALLTIKRAALVRPGMLGWFVEWEIIQCRPIDEAVRGRCRFSNEDLSAAFGLSNVSGKFGQWLIDRFGADVAEQGKYIRWEDFLNIPCPGTGNDGDPNISIRLNAEIQDAVARLLKQ